MGESWDTPFIDWENRNFVLNIGTEESMSNECAPAPTLNGFILLCSHFQQKTDNNQSKQGMGEGLIRINHTYTSPSQSLQVSPPFFANASPISNYPLPLSNARYDAIKKAVPPGWALDTPIFLILCSKKWKKMYSPSKRWTLNSPGDWTGGGSNCTPLY